MTFFLALRNLKTKPLRTVVTVLAIALAVAVIFCMFSFNQAVYEYIFDVETADSGNKYGIEVSYKSGGDKTVSAAALEDINGVEESVGTLDFYWLFGDEYVALRGFEQGKYTELQPIDVVDGDLSLLEKKADYIVVSESAAKRYLLSCKDGNNAVKLIGADNTEYVFTVAAIAKDTGYFASGQPFTFVGSERGLVRLVVGASAQIYNTMYVKLAQGANLDAVLDEIKANAAFASLNVSKSVDYADIETKADNMSSTVTIAGLAVVLLAVAGIAILFALSARDKRDYISKLTVVGATRSQLVEVFLYENVFLAFVGALVGSLVGVGLLALLLFATLGNVATFDVSAWKLAVSAIIGALTALVSSSVPLVNAFKGTVRENALDISKKSVSKTALPLAFALASAVCAVIALTVEPLKGAMSLVAIVAILIALVAVAEYPVKAFAKLCAKSDVPSVKIASRALARDRQGVQAARLLTVGMTVSMLLFSSWAITTEIFSGFVSQFENMVFVKNVSADDVDTLKGVEGAKDAVALLWQQGTIDVNGTSRSVNVLGSQEIVNAVEFGFVDDESTIRDRLNSSGEYVYLDEAYVKLYGVRTGDKVTLDLNGTAKELEVGGILSQELFSGNYAVLSTATIKSAYGEEVDTVLISVQDGENVNDVVGRLRSEFVKDKNYLAVGALEAYEWDTAFLDGVFALVGALAFMVSVLMFFALTASTVVSHTLRARERETLLNAGTSKKVLFRSELFEHGYTAAISLMISFAVSYLTIALLVNAVRLFGLYFATAWDAFVAKSWINLVVGLALAALYTLLPIVLNYKHSYKLKTN